MSALSRPSSNVQQFSNDLEEHNDDSWMISYIDVFVLMSTVFVMLLVLSREELKDNSAQPASEQVKMPVEKIVDVSDLALGVASKMSHIQTEQWIETISTSIEHNGLDGLVTVIKEDNFTELAIQSRVLFSSGTSALTRSGEDVLEKLVPVLTEVEGLVFIEGHTDDKPISTARFASNWDLASARATDVLQFFVAEGIKKSKFRVVSYGDTKPLVENTTEENRQKNRRVSLMIQRQL